MGEMSFRLQDFFKLNPSLECLKLVHHFDKDFRLVAKNRIETFSWEVELKGSPNTKKTFASWAFFYFPLKNKTFRRFF